MLDEPANVVGCFSQKKDAERVCKELEDLSKGHSISYYVQSRLLNNLITINEIKEHYSKDKMIISNSPII